MGRARHLSASASACALAVALLAALAGAGCGSSGSGSSSGERPQGGQAPLGATAHTCAASTRGVGELRVTGVTCSAAVGVAAGWAAKDNCAMAKSASRGSCTVGRYRCLAAATQPGLAVSCARPDRSISFIARRG
jgi:hypothetical protein